MTQAITSVNSPPCSRAQAGFACQIAPARRERIFALVYRQMTALAGRSVDLDDLVQTAAEQTLRSLDGFDGRAELSTWTYRICHNVYLKQRRWYRRWLARFSFWEDASLVQPSDTRPNQDQACESNERRARLWNALEQISAKRRVVLALHDLEGLTVEQIAEIVDCNPLTVRSRLRDGRKMLARALASDPYFGSCACNKEPE